MTTMHPVRKMAVTARRGATSFIPLILPPASIWQPSSRELFSWIRNGESDVCDLSTCEGVEDVHYAIIEGGFGGLDGDQ